MQVHWRAREKASVHLEGEQRRRVGRSKFDRRCIGEGNLHVRYQLASRHKHEDRRTQSRNVLVPSPTEEHINGYMHP